MLTPKREAPWGVWASRVKSERYPTTVKTAHEAGFLAFDGSVEWEGGGGRGRGGCVDAVCCACVVEFDNPL